MKQVFLHIGAHKTATTTIQRVLLRHPDLMSDAPDAPLLLSIHNPVHGYEAFRLPYTHVRNRMLLAIREGRPVADEWILEMRDLVADFVHRLPAKQIVWSDENLLGNTPGHPVGPRLEFHSGLYPASAHIASAFSQALEGHDVKVRLYERDIGNLVRSSYADWIAKLRDPTDFEDFVGFVMNGEADWSSVAAPWRRNFGTAFDMVPFETIKEGQGAFLANFAQWARLSLTDPRSLDAIDGVNQSFNDRQISLAKLIMPHISDEERTALRRFLRMIAKST